jgi:hypothetical protein
MKLNENFSLGKRKDRSQLLYSANKRNVSMLVLNCTFVQGMNVDQCVMCDV